MYKDKLLKIQQKIAIVLLLIVFLAFVYKKEYSTATFSNYYRTMMLNKEFNGVVIEIEEDKDNRNEITYTFENGGYKLNALADKWNRIIDIGDTVLKKKNELLFVVKKSNGSQFKFDYNDYLIKMDEVGYYSTSILDNEH